MESCLIHICKYCAEREGFSIHPELPLKIRICYNCNQIAGGLPMNNLHWFKSCEHNKRNNTDDNDSMVDRTN